MTRTRHVLVATFTLAAVAGLAIAQADTVGALQALRDATHAGDPRAFAEQFHEDAEVTEFGAEVQRFTGRGEIQGWASYLVDLDTHLEFWSCQGTTQSATCRFAVASDATRTLDVGSLEGTVSARFEEGLIETLIVEFTEADLARFEAALAASNKELYRKLNRVVLNGKNLDALERFVAEGFVDHGALPGQAPSLEGTRQTLAMLFQAFPDLEITIEHLVADGSLVIAHGTARGTHEGAFLGVPPTGETVTWEFFDMGRVQNGRFVERWGLDDTLGIMQQLGVAPSPAEDE